MADKKISELVNLTSLATDDEFVVVDADANATKRTTYGNLSSVIRGDIVDGDMPAGSIVQVVNAFTQTEVVNSTTSFADTGLTATITPTSASNKILVLFSQSAGADRATSQQGISLLCKRDSTEIWRLSSFSNLVGFYLNSGSTTQTDLYGAIAANILDAPSTTSALTYKLQGRPSGITSTGFARFQANNNASSSITLLEVVA